MICQSNCTVEDKIQAIQDRTPDQKMTRTPVPVSIGGRVFGIRPLVRKHARAFRQRWAQMATMILEPIGPSTNNDHFANSILSVLEGVSEAEPLQLQVLALAIPELSGQEEWIDDNATNEELAEAMVLALHINGMGNPQMPLEGGRT